MTKKFKVVLLTVDKPEHRGLVFVGTWNSYAYMDQLKNTCLAKDESFVEMYIVEPLNEITESDIGTWFMIDKGPTKDNTDYFTSKLKKIDSGAGRYPDTYCFENGYSTNMIGCCNKLITTSIYYYPNKHMPPPLPSIPVSYLKAFSRVSPKKFRPTSVLLEMEGNTVKVNESNEVIISSIPQRVNMEYEIDERDKPTILQFDKDDQFRNFLRHYHLTHVWEKYLKSEPVFTCDQIIADMDDDMENSGMAQGEIESNLNHWKNKYLIIKR